MTPIRADLSREEVAAAVCDALDRAGISVVLSGGAVVSIYSENEYESFDLDFIPTGLARKVDDVMAELDFRREGRRVWASFGSSRRPNASWTDSPATTTGMTRSASIRP